ncbi:MAG: transposase [Leptolyngbyaceae cyanobacterium HOT.MB2.61]|nr:transposase [Leptolyngbyaceae cyanobacterium HOT.MB2.61]
MAKVDWPREAFWLYGVVEPLNRWHWSQTSAHLNQVNFQQFLNDLSEALGDTVAVMQLDRALAHRAKAIQWPKNIIPLFQPPHSPELNPIERFWQHLKGNLGGRELPLPRRLKAAG